jgi:hypothetical protein
LAAKRQAEHLLAVASQAALERGPKEAAAGEKALVKKPREELTQQERNARKAVALERLKAVQVAPQEKTTKDERADKEKKKKNGSSSQGGKQEEGTTHTPLKPKGGMTGKRGQRARKKARKAEARRQETARAKAEMEAKQQAEAAAKEEARVQHIIECIDKVLGEAVDLDTYEYELDRALELQSDAQWKRLACIELKRNVTKKDTDNESALLTVMEARARESEDTLMFVSLAKAMSGLNQKGFMFSVIKRGTSIESEIFTQEGKGDKMQCTPEFLKMCIKPSYPGDTTQAIKLARLAYQFGNAEAGFLLANTLLTIIVPITPGAVMKRGFSTEAVKALLDDKVVALHPKEAVKLASETITEWNSPYSVLYFPDWSIECAEIGNRASELGIDIAKEKEFPLYMGGITGLGMPPAGISSRFNTTVATPAYLRTALMQETGGHDMGR